MSNQSEYVRTPSFAEDIRMWRRTAAPEDLPELEAWIVALEQEAKRQMEVR